MTRPGDYAVRDLRPEDLAGISRVHWRACRLAYRFMNWSYTEDEVRRWYAGKLPEWDWGRTVWGDGELVGYLAASGSHIDQLFVDPGHQRVGVGKALLTAMLDRQLRPATLNVFEENAPARKFYETFGFRAASRSWKDDEQAFELLYTLD